jgi:hypothetical protein
MDNIEASIHHELMILLRDYSPMRRSRMKWVYSSTETTEVPHNPIEIMGLHGKGFAVIYRSSTHSLEKYHLETLNKRISIKRALSLFYGIQQLWKFLNPFHLKALSKELCVKLNEYICANFKPEPTSNTSNALKYSLNDVDIDFEGKNYLLFGDFYDSIFEVLDNISKSYLVNEYVRLVRNIQDSLIQAPWFNTLQLHSKAHIPEIHKPTHQGWMINLLRDSNLNTPKKFSKENQMSRSSRQFRTFKSSRTLPDTLLNRVSISRERIDIDHVTRTIMRFKRMNRDIQSEKAFRKSSLHITEKPVGTPLQSLSKRNSLQIQIKTQRLLQSSPISTYLRGGKRSSKILENVIEGRQTFMQKFLEQDNEICKFINHH